VTCREFAEFILDYLSGDLPDEVRARFERHLARCPNCPEYLRQYERAMRAGRLAFSHADEPVPADVPDDLVAAILTAAKGMTPGSNASPNVE
jgi:anti-sigma factor RsiW